MLQSAFNNSKAGIRITTTGAFIASLFTLLVASPAYAITGVQIGNGPSQVNGTYLNAQDIADNLVFTSIFVQATGNVTVVDPIDLSTSTFGTPHFTLTISAPVCNISNNVNMAATGHLNLTCGTLNLNGQITSGGTKIDPSRITGTATQVNVVSNSASIQQAIDASSNVSAPVITVGAGQYTENLTINRALTLSGNDGSNPTGADPNAPTINGTQPGGNVITVTGNGVTIDGLHLNGLVNAGSSTPSVDGFFANNVDSFAAAHNTLDGFSGPGIDTTGSTNVVLNANNIILPPPTEIPAAVTGFQTYGSANPAFLYIVNPPSGVSVTGNLGCTTVDNGTAIDANLSAGSHTIDASSCAGLAVSDIHYAILYTSVANDFTVNTASQTVSFTSTAPSNAVVAGTTYTPTASATSGLPAAITVDLSSSAVCSISGGVVSYQSAGTCKLDANQSGNSNYNAAPQVQQSFTVKAPAITWSGFLQPINTDGSSIFKLGRTVPIKFQLTGASAGISNLQAKLYVSKVDNNIDGTDVEAISTAAADSGNTFRYDPTSHQYIFNLGTSSLTTGTYKFKIYVNGDNTTGILLGTVNVSIK